MNLHRYFPQTTDELASVLEKHGHEAKSVAMQAGHFLLYYDIQSGELLPCIEESITAPYLTQLKNTFTRFPALTWALGLELLSGLKCRDKFVLIVVNDWQYVPHDIDRARFYERSNKLPQSYERLFSSYANQIVLLQPKAVRTGLSTRPFFSEMNQRNQFRRHIEKMIRHNMLPPTTRINRNDAVISCSLPSDIAPAGRDFYCRGKSPDCAAQIAQMLFQAQKATQCDCFINLYPLVCRTYVESGTELASDLFGTPIRTVINVGLPSAGIASASDMVQNSEVSVHLFK